MKPPFCGAAALTAALLVFAAPACKHPQVHVVDTVEEGPRLASIVRMADPATAGQLAGGFYDIEGNAWRWTQPKFAVNLRPPARSAQNGATLELVFTIPPASISRLGSLTLSAAIAGNALAPETYTKPGPYTYRREVAAGLLAGDAVRIDFQLDKAFAPGGADRRELGIVASSVALVPI